MCFSKDLLKTSLNLPAYHLVSTINSQQSAMGKKKIFLSSIWPHPLLQQKLWFQNIITTTIAMALSTSAIQLVPLCHLPYQFQLVEYLQPCFRSGGILFLMPLLWYHFPLSISTQLIIGSPTKCKALCILSVILYTEQSILY